MVRHEVGHRIRHEERHENKPFPVRHLKALGSGRYQGIGVRQAALGHEEIDRCDKKSARFPVRACF